MPADQGLEAVYPKPKLSTSHPEHKAFPYLLRGVAITRCNQVWSTDISFAITLSAGRSTRPVFPTGNRAEASTERSAVGPQAEAHSPNSRVDLVQPIGVRPSCLGFAL